MNESKLLKQRTDGLISPDELPQEFGKDFDAASLRNTHRFYLTCPIQETVSPKFRNWSHNKDFLHDPYVLAFLNLISQQLLKTNPEQERIKVRAQLKYKISGVNHD